MLALGVLCLASCSSLGRHKTTHGSQHDARCSSWALGLPGKDSISSLMQLMSARKLAPLFLLLLPDNDVVQWRVWSSSMIVVTSGQPAPLRASTIRWQVRWQWQRRRRQLQHQWGRLWPFSFLLTLFQSFALSFLAKASWDMRKNTPTGAPCADLGTLVYKSRWLLWNIISLEVYNISYGRPHRRCMKLRERLQNISRGIKGESHIIISRLIKIFLSDIHHLLMSINLTPPVT